MVVIERVRRISPELAEVVDGMPEGIVTVHSQLQPEGWNPQRELLVDQCSPSR